MTRPIAIAIALLGLLLIGTLAFFVYRSIELKAQQAAAIAEAARIAQAASEERAALVEQLATSEQATKDLALALERERRQSRDYEAKVEDLSDTVTTLTKTIETDPELLAKYSKVYFLNENYVPIGLEKIDPAYAFEEGRTYEIHRDVKQALERMLEDAKEDGHSLLVASAYRSFATQAALKSGYRVRFGSGANAFSAEQGYSEHQLATTIDLTTRAVGGTFVGFDRTEAYDWLTDNAWKYGFVLSYPKGNSYYQYEPWHWRFVGKDLAKRLHEEERWFYDLDQRVIDTYLGGIFD